MTTPIDADTEMTGTSIDLAMRSAVRWRVPVSDVGMEGLGMRCTLARAMRAGVGRHDDGPVQLGQLRQPLGRELGVEEEAAGADGQHVGVVTDHDEGAPIGEQHPLEPVAQRLSRERPAPEPRRRPQWFAPQKNGTCGANVDGPPGTDADEGAGANEVDAGVVGAAVTPTPAHTKRDRRFHGRW